MILSDLKERESELPCYKNFYREVEEIRKGLNNLIIEKNENLLDEEVIKLSQYLDRLILKYQYIVKKIHSNIYFIKE